MKRVLVLYAAASVSTGVASAADLPVYEVATVAPAAVVADNIWSGFYLGAQAGYAFGDSGDNCFLVVNGPDSWDCDFFEGTQDQSLSSDAFFAGLHIGADVQIGSLVLGGILDANRLLEDDELDGRFDIDTYNDAGIDIQETGTYPTISYDASTLEWYGTLRGRAGFAMGPLLIYGTGGVAFADGADSSASAYLANDNEVTNYFTGAENGIDTVAEAVALDECGADGAGVTCSMDDADDGFKLGWALGAGIEVLATEHFSVGLEYLFVNLENDSVSLDHLFDAGELSGSINRDNDFHTVAMKASYRF